MGETPQTNTGLSPSSAGWKGNCSPLKQCGREVNSYVVALNVQRALLARATVPARVTKVMCSCTVGTVCHVNVHSAVRLSAPERQEQQALDATFLPEGTAEATQLLQQLFLLHYYQSLLSGHSLSLLGSRKSTCSYLFKKQKRSVLRRKVLPSLLCMHTEKNTADLLVYFSPSPSGVTCHGLSY